MSDAPLKDLAPAAQPPLRSVHTNTLPALMDRLGISLAVTTYQAGKLVLLRPEPRATGPVLNTHFRPFVKPMGFAAENGRFALGTQGEIWEFHNVPSVAPKLDEPSGPAKHDAAFLPRHRHYTGDIQIHEMVWAAAARGDSSGVAGNVGAGEAASGLSELWFVNTRFSCLATLSPIYSFIPRWTPPFISGLAPEDRCHLNGLCLRDGRPRYATALGSSDTPGGWRDHKRDGGVLIDIPSGEILLGGLSMPHSPRWRQDKLWLLESGNGSVGFIDPKSGKYESICKLPGFTRGFDFIGPYAFVGLSQVRESATFSGIAIAERPQSERSCGVWAIDTRSGEVVGFVKFMDAVQEIFAVNVLPAMRWPDVVSEDAKRIDETYELPDAALRQVPGSWKDSLGAVPDAG